MPEMNKNVLVWIDTETTGLNTSKCKLLEVGVVITNGELEELASQSHIIHYPESFFSDWLASGVFERTAYEMHKQNGLLGDVANWDTSKPIDFAEVQIIALIDNYVSPTEPLPAGGGSNFGGYDKAVLRRFMPRLMNRLHHRSMDTTTMKVAADLWGLQPSFFNAKVNRSHRALDDIRQDIELARKLREIFISGQATYEATMEARAITEKSREWRRKRQQDASPS